jgi:uncharacterized protein YerC
MRLLINKFTSAKEELENLLLIEKEPYTEIGKQFGVSDNAIKRRCVALGIDPYCVKTQVKRSQK